MLSADDSPEFSQLIPPLILPVLVEEAAPVSETGVTPLIMPVVEELDNDTPATELVEMKTTTPEYVVPPPPGFLPFLFPENDGGMEFIDISSYRSGVIGQSGRNGRASSGWFVLSLKGQFVGSDTGGRLRLLAPVVG